MTARRIVKVVHHCSVWLEITQTWLYNLVKYLPQDFENHVVCRSARHLEHFAVDHIHALKDQSLPTYLYHQARRLLGKKDNAFLADQLQRIQPDLLHSHFGNNGWKALPAATAQQCPHFVSFYGQDVSKLPKENPIWFVRYRELFANSYARFLCEGRHMAQSLVAMGCPEHKIHVHHLGVELEHIPFQPRQWQPGEPFKVLIAASFREKKGIPYALEALGKLQHELPLAITLVGDADKSKGSQEEKRRILEIIKRQRMGAIVRMRGYQPQHVLWEEAFNHHLFLSPSVTAANGDTEGGVPVAIIEMVASGMPVVSSLHCDIPEVILQGRTGWLAEERDINGIIIAIRRWLDRPQDWPMLLHAGRRHIETDYNAVTQGQRLAQLYQRALS